MSESDANKNHPRNNFRRNKYRNGDITDRFFYNMSCRMPPYWRNPYMSFVDNCGRINNRRSKRLAIKNVKKKPSRPPSPFCGTEEYTLKKIQETSDMIKKQLLMPPQTESQLEPPCSRAGMEDGNNTGRNEVEQSDKQNTNETSTLKLVNNAVNYNIEEIHEKIINHISNLSYNKKKNLICSTSSGYDIVIHNIQKQKRLELSKALRDMCSNQTPENTEFVNSIIPDIGIKIEDLPMEVIQELSNNLDYNFIQDNYLRDNSKPSTSVDNFNHFEEIDETVLNIKTEMCENPINLELQTQQTSLNSNESLLDMRQDISQINFSFHSNIKQEYVSDSPNELPSNVYNPEDVVKRCISTSAAATDTSDLTTYNSVSTQTEEMLFDHDQFKAETLDDAIEAMYKIDNEVKRLTTLRQSLFLDVKKLRKVKKKKRKKIDDSVANTTNPTKKKRKKIDDSVTNTTNPTKKKRKKIQDAVTNTTNPTKKKRKKIHDPVTNSTNPTNMQLATPQIDLYEKELEFLDIVEKILALLVIKDTIVAGSESGKVFFINATDGVVVGTVQVCRVPITAIVINKLDKASEQQKIYVGSYEWNIREYDLATKSLVDSFATNDSTTCMECYWSFIFIGTTNGNLARYSLSKRRIVFEDKISDSSIMVVKAAQEGARRVLLIGSKMSPVCVRDAMSGLHLRTMDGLTSATVYSLVLENSLLFCGTTSHDILVYRFHDGQLLHTLNNSNSKGISCLKVHQNFLFASCHNGYIYVYDTKNYNYVGMIQGPGGVILSMEVIKNLVIVGTMSFKFSTILIPDQILRRK